jgi:hypothetical protein
MGFLKKITRPISRALDKIIPNEVKPALPFLAAAAPFMAPGLMGLGGNTMLSRALMSGGLNLGAQLAQEGSEGDFSALSLAMASGIGALSAPNAASTIRGVDPNFVGPRPAAEGILGQGKEYLARGAEFLGPQTGGVTDILGKGGTQAGLNMETLKAASIPFTQGTTDLAVAENRRAMRDYERELADYEAGMNEENSNRAFAIRQSMEAYGFTEQEILDAIEAAGYANGGRVGYAFGDLVRGSSMVQPAGGLAIKLNRPVESGDPLGSYYPDPSKMKTASPIMPSSGMGGMLSNLINSNPQIFSNLTGQTNNSVSNMSRDFIDLNQNGIDDRQEKAYGGRVGLKDGGRVGLEFGGIPAAVESVEEKPKEFLVDKLKVTVQPGQSEQMAIMNAMMNDIDEVMPEDRKMEFYKLYLPQLRASGEISEKEYEGLMGELFGEGKAEGGRIGLQEGGVLAQILPQASQITTLSQRPLLAGLQPLRQAESVFPRLNQLEQGVGRAEETLGRIRSRLGPEQKGTLASFQPMLQPALGYEPLNMLNLNRGMGISALQSGPEAQGMKDGGLMNLGGREMDMRTGGFIPIGKKERADDVPARLSKNEFVMTADAVRAAGGGSVNEGARRMYNLMNNLEAKV